MIDLHSHVLPGVDDGPEDLEGALAICRAAAEDGIEVLAATPHVRAHDYPTTAEQMEVALATVAAAAGDIVRLVPGGELDLGELGRPVEELRRFALAGNPRYLLVETPYLGWPLDIADRLFELRTSGITPVLAHPERNADVQAQPGLIEPLVATGTLVQVTAASLDGRLGGHVRACARGLLDRGLVHLLASDAHEASVRAIGMRAAAEAVGDADLAQWLTVGVPGAIVNGDRIPARPEPAKKKRFGLF